MSMYTNHPLPKGMSKGIFKYNANNIKTINTSRFNFRGGIRL